MTRRMEDFKRRFDPVALFARAGLVNGSTSVGFKDKYMACRYEPGSIERDWLHGPAFGSICAIARRTSQLSALQKSLAYNHLWCVCNTKSDTKHIVKVKVSC